jgi:hypothetical protein
MGEKAGRGINGANQWLWKWSPTGGSPHRFSLCPASTERPLWSGNGLGAMDTVFDRAGRKEALGRAAGFKILSGASQILLEAALENVGGDAFSTYRNLVMD